MANKKDTSEMAKIWIKVRPIKTTTETMESELDYWDGNLYASSTTAKTKLNEFIRTIKNTLLDTTTAYGYKLIVKQKRSISEF